MSRSNDEFANQIGDRQGVGAPRVLGLPPPRPPQQTKSDGAAPPYSRQVVSGFDSRPIGAYDWVSGDNLTAYDDGGGVFEFNDFPQFVSPPGYITTLRRLVIEGTPGFSSPGDNLAWRLTVGGITQPNWVWWHGGIINSPRHLDTFIVVPPNTTVQLVPNFSADLLTSGLIAVQFSGNLILDANEPATEQVGSNPQIVRATAILDPEKRT